MRKFVESSDLTNTAVGLIAFADRREVVLKAVRDAKKVLHAIDSLRIGMVGIGNDAHPFDDAEKLLRHVSGVKFIVVLADGIWSCQPAAIQGSHRCRSAGSEVIAVGFGSADHEFLKKIASADQSALFHSSSQLPQAFEQIAQVVLEGGSLSATRSR
jgi:deferrochelatase/peroxidase EfeB